MRRGTTPTHTFIVDVDLTDAEVLWITYAQSQTKMETKEIRGCLHESEDPEIRIVLEKELQDIMVESDKISTKLTQEETMRFTDDEDVMIQIAAKFADQSAIRSEIIYTSVQSILKDEVI